jgi:hypothetical protein
MPLTVASSAPFTGQGSARGPVRMTGALWAAAKAPRAVADPGKLSRAHQPPSVHPRRLPVYDTLSSCAMRDALRLHGIQTLAPVWPSRTGWRAGHETRRGGVGQAGGHAAAPSSFGAYADKSIGQFLAAAPIIVPVAASRALGWRRRQHGGVGRRRRQLGGRHDDGGRDGGPGPVLAHTAPAAVALLEIGKLCSWAQIRPGL